MMDLKYPQGAMPLSRDEAEGLIPTHITTRNELNIWEQDNINDAIAWLERRKPADILNERFTKQLHKRMFGNVWKWAGTFRQSDKNIGVAWHQIPVELKKLFDDVEYWIEHKTFDADEAAARFHHRLVSIHPFANGNGRHARLMANLLLENVLNRPRFTWGGADIVKSGDDRKRYIESLTAADRNDYQPLLDFARS